MNINWSVEITQETHVYKLKVFFKTWTELSDYCLTTQRIRQPAKLYVLYISYKGKNNFFC